MHQVQFRGARPLAIFKRGLLFRGVGKAEEGMKGKRTREGTEGRGWEKRRGGPPNANSWIRACALIRRGTIRFELTRTLYITVNVERT